MEEHADHAIQWHSQWGPRVCERIQGPPLPIATLLDSHGAGHSGRDDDWRSAWTPNTLATRLTIDKISIQRLLIEDLGKT